MVLFAVDFGVALVVVCVRLQQIILNSGQLGDAVEPALWVGTAKTQIHAPKSVRSDLQMLGPTSVEIDPRFLSTGFSSMISSKSVAKRRV